MCFLSSGFERVNKEIKSLTCEKLRISVPPRSAEREEENEEEEEEEEEEKEEEKKEEERALLGPAPEVPTGPTFGVLIEATYQQCKFDVKRRTGLVEGGDEQAGLHAPPSPFIALSQSRCMPYHRLKIADGEGVVKSEKPRRRNAMLDLVLSNKEGLVGNVKLKGSLGHSDDEIVEFKILRAARRVHSKLTALDFKRVDSGLFRDLLGRV
ncbi:nucleoside diphosphate kinase 6 [Grus japonensis]|uniref:Nucleoside diphosphate kinase 6 n=1 Tax=Grus japonensis TaxID=30415 RepID=A0ABC9Y2H9_GRUJA